MVVKCEASLPYYTARLAYCIMSSCPDSTPCPSCITYARNYLYVCAVHWYQVRVASIYKNMDITWNSVADMQRRTSLKVLGTCLQFYLAGDRLCYEDTPSASAEIKYIPLDRIPMRALPHGYRPSLGVTLIDDR